jgi:hypothetical protein
MTGRARRLALATVEVVTVGALTLAASGCGQDDEPPTAPDATRAEVTGTVTTTVPRSTSTTG